MSGLACYDARPDPRATVISTSTRNFPNRLGKGAYLSSAELAAVAAMLGRLPTVEEYMAKAATVNAKAGGNLPILDFHLMEKYREGRGR